MKATEAVQHPGRSHWLKQPLRLLYPTKCVLCGDIITGEDRELCPKCRDNLPRTDEGSRIQYGVYFSRCLSPMHYQGELRSSFRRYKFQGQWQYSALYSRWMLEALGRYAADWPIDMVTWVPLNRWRLMRRGYDQTRLLAQPVAKYLGLPLIPALVKRHIPPQSRLNAEKRAKNVKDAFRLRPGVEAEGKCVLLVDDLITTGATLEEAASVLLAAGAAEVCCLTLACGRDG